MSKFVSYAKSSVLTVTLCFILARGPHGGWMIGLMAALFIGLSLSAIFWLLDFSWYWNILLAPAISLLSVGLAFAVIKYRPSIDNAQLDQYADIVIVVLIFSILIEATLFVQRSIKK